MLEKAYGVSVEYKEDMKQFAVQVVLLLIIIMFGLITTTNRQNLVGIIPGGGNLAQQLDKAELRIVDPQTNSTKASITTILASTPEKRRVGLGQTESLGVNEGMLFEFEDPGQYKFWMKNLKFGLDFIFILNNQVVQVLENIPPPAPGQADETLPIYSPTVNINKVLEVNSGFVAERGIKVGDLVYLSREQATPGQGVEIN